MDGLWSICIRGWSLCCKHRQSYHFLCNVNEWSRHARFELATGLPITVCRLLCDLNAHIYAHNTQIVQIVTQVHVREQNFVTKPKARNIRRSQHLLVPSLYIPELNRLVETRDNYDIRPSEIANAHPLGDDPMVRRTASLGRAGQYALGFGIVTVSVTGRISEGTICNGYSTYSYLLQQLMRELAAIHRSDASLIVSTHEIELLTDTYGVHPRKLHLGREDIWTFTNWHLQTVPVSDLLK